MKTSYKFWYVKKEDNINISEVAVRFYEGDLFDVQIKKVDQQTQTQTIEVVKKYVRTKRLQKEDVPHEINRKTIKEFNGNDCFVYTPDDYGITSDIDDVIVYLNNVLSMDSNRVPEDTQKETDKNKLKLQSLK